MAEAKKKKQTKAITKANSGKPTLSSLLDLKLTPEIVHSYLCPKATPEEIKVFIYECQAFGLNPFKREIYLIKYKQDDPAKSVVGYEVYLKRADRSKNWNGIAFGTDGSGSDMTAWCKVYRKDWDEPLYHTVDFEEYAQRKGPGGTGELNRFWERKPKTMLKKVVIAQALRMAFPDEFAGMPYIVEEVSDIDMHSLPDGSDRYFDTTKVENHFKKEDLKTEEKKEETKKEEKQELPVPAKIEDEKSPPTIEEPFFPDEEEAADDAEEAPQSLKMEINRLMATLVDNYGFTPDKILKRLDEKVESHNINELTKDQADVVIKDFKWVISEMEKRKAKKQAQA